MFILDFLAILGIFGPFLIIFFILFYGLLFGKGPKEDFIGKVIGCFMVGLSLGSFFLFFKFLFSSKETFIQDMLWIFHIDVFSDRHSAILLFISTIILGVTGNFSFRYLHKDPHYLRFFIFYLIFVSGFYLLCLGDDLPDMILGWEFLGLSSTFLIGFFQDRTQPVKNSLLAYGTYKLTDLGLLVALALWHGFHLPEHVPSFFEASGLSMPFWASNLLAVCLIFSISGKSALFPFSFWLPKAMEGPTPSSAIFYGALSIHGGAILALRLSSFFQDVPVFWIFLFVISFVTCVLSFFCGMVRPDIKTQLAYASLTQVSLILIEISIGYFNLAFFHILAHMTYRTVQMLSSPSILQVMMPKIFESKKRQNSLSSSMIVLYRWSLFSFYLEGFILRFFVFPFIYLSQTIHRIESFFSFKKKGEI